MKNSPAVKLLDRPIPPEVAAQLLAVDPALFDGQAKLTLRTAFRLALRPAIEARHASRGKRRAVLRRDVTVAKAEARAVSASALTLALSVTARQIEWDVTEVADRLAVLDPKAAAKLRKAAQAATETARRTICAP